MTPQQIKAYFVLVLSIMLWAWNEAHAQSAPERASIDQVTISGSGCNDTTAAVSLSPDFKDVSVLFDNYRVEIGQGSENPSLMKASKNCTISMNIYAPPRWQFAFVAVDYRGFAAVPASAWAFHRFTFVTANQRISSMREASIKGPSNGDYNVHFEQSPHRLTWSTCGKDVHNIQLLSQLSVQYFPRSTDRSIAQINLDSADTSTQQDLTMVWRPCP
jgi:hypothetical protein